MQGTSVGQDNRFADKEKKLMASMKFDPVLEEKVDLAKVRLETIKPWIARKVTELVNFEDDVLIEYIFNILEDKSVRVFARARARAGRH